MTSAELIVSIARQLHRMATILGYASVALIFFSLVGAAVGQSGFAAQARKLLKDCVFFAALFWAFAWLIA